MALIASLLVGAFIAMWYVVPPISPYFVLKVFPWTEPQIRARGIIHRAGNGGDVVWDGWAYLADRFKTHPQEVEQGLLTCLQSDNISHKQMAQMYINVASPLSPALRQEVIKMINDHEGLNRGYAILLLKEFSPDIGRPLLEKFAQSQIQDDQIPAVKSLVDRGTVQYIPLISIWLKDSNPNIRRTAIELLEQIQDPNANELVRPLLQDPEHFVARKAEEYFNRMKRLE